MIENRVYRLWYDLDLYFCGSPCQVVWRGMLTCVFIGPCGFFRDEIQPFHARDTESELHFLSYGSG
jgi:hypothetical protein